MARTAKKRAPIATRRKPARKGPQEAATPAPAMVRILNCLPSRDTEKDWQFENAVDAGLVAAAPIPQAKDLRESWWTIND